VPDEQTIHVRLPESTYNALMRERKAVGDDVALSVVVRRLLDKALGITPPKKKAAKR